jgi:hypothetical protein
MDSARFLQLRPEFNDPLKYSLALITQWLEVSTFMLNERRFGQVFELAQSLFVSHHLSLQALMIERASAGGDPGSIKGPITSKSGGPISISYDIGSILNARDGHWNLTIYGIQLASLFQMYGAGPVQLGIGEVPPLSGQAWPGVIILY